MVEQFLLRILLVLAILVCVLGLLSKAEEKFSTSTRLVLVQASTQPCPANPKMDILPKGGWNDGKVAKSKDGGVS